MDLKLFSGFTYRGLSQHMNFFWGAFFPREHFFGQHFFFMESMLHGSIFFRGAFFPVEHFFGEHFDKEHFDGEHFLPS